MLVSSADFPEPVGPAIRTRPYALLPTDGRLFAGLADGQLWESRDRGDTWACCRVEGDALPGVVALAAG